MTRASLEDRFQRKINYLRLSVTDRCNLRCTYCMPPDGVAPLGHGEILSYEEMLRVARVALALGVEKIRVTGGEPLVRRGIVGFVERLAALPELRDLSLTTNGMQLADMATALRRAGLRRVNVSLDSLKPDVFHAITRRPALPQVLAGLRAAREAGLSPVKVNVVALRGVNDGEILDFAKFGQEQGCEVRFIEFMPSRGECWEEKHFLPAAEILDILATRYDLRPADSSGFAGPSRTFVLPGGSRVGVISPLSNHFCGSCNRLRLTAEGRLRSCLFSRREVDLRGLLRGHATDAALAEAIRDAVEHKPERHGVEDREREECALPMSRVGG